jgi:hypothetical protein
VPAEIEDGIDLVAFHDDNRRKYAGAFFIYMLFGAIANSFIQGFQSAVLLSFGFAALAAIAWIWRDARVQWLAIGGLYVGIAYYSATYISHL